MTNFGSKRDSKTDWRQRRLKKPGNDLLERRGQDDSRELNILLWQDNIFANCIAICMHET
jgi:hypothetical protein